MCLQTIKGNSNQLQNFKVTQHGQTKFETSRRVDILKTVTDI